MARWIKVLACALMVLAPAVSAQEAVLIDNQPAAFETLQPGTPVVIRSAQPIMLREGTYVLINEPAPAALSHIPA